MAGAYILRSLALVMLASVASAEMCLPTMTGPELLKQRNLSMEGKVVVLTGGTTGIGYGIATALASAGAKLFMLGYHEESASASAANISKATGNPNIEVIAPFDLSSFKSIDAAVTKIQQVAPKIDVLVCDAGLDSERPGIPTITEDGYEVTFQVTFLGHFKLTEALLPQLRSAKGRVVNTGSITSLVNNLTYTLAEYADGTFCAQQGVDGNCITLDYISTAMKKPAPTVNGTLSNFGHFFKTFYTYEFSAREATNGVVMYTGHPGAVVSPAAIAAGFLNKTFTTDFCSPLSWTYCCCVSDPSMKFDIGNCLLTPQKGSAQNSWLAAAPREDIEGDSSDNFFSLCQPLDDISNQYRALALATSEVQAAQYSQDLSALWKHWTA